MDKSRGFLQYKRQMPAKRSVEERVQDSMEIYLPVTQEHIVQQATRCMDCGIPFCQSGCPLGNRIPDWNDLVFRANWREAYDQLTTTNNFPEFTGRVCPAPCEAACVLGVTDDPVTIERIEQEIVEQAYREGWVLPNSPTARTGKKVAVIGSGPAGLAAADQLNKAGHFVTVYERDDRPGGLLQYGIPDFKLEKRLVSRRVDVMKASGIRFECGAEVGANVPVSELEEYDAVVLCIGATKPRGLPISGHELNGVHYAWDFLWQQNKRVAGDDMSNITPIHAEGKHVIVIGGGDTGSDCVGTANRQGAKSVTQFELLPMPPEDRPEDQPWPFYPMKLTVSTSHEEGVERHWSIMTRKFEGKEGDVASLETVEVVVQKDEHGRMQFAEQPGSETTWPADLVLLAIGYTGPEQTGVVAGLEVALDERGNIQTEEGYQTSVPGVFAAGDGRRGQSLVVWAISEGREAAREVDAYLMGSTSLPTKGEGDLPRV